ncbi:complex I subunit 5 family protein [Nitrosomonas communis]|uniref:Formate hydrogenlyase subunit 3/Multisubunit Na+/H+ antiporter, MnhD subunit n=1 Tax=Nitrosomonas communis TaxID=44574 RepID=A0A1H2YED4_9PROT|nr:proton-conducting transporter membrane subunit [Nitrosomonas communis]SDX03420.1 Formate hydrogenlyase subunit 3/Multisubunit Na+/H+ antiporter, MnhD subunit [Nitrosomonas communis]
MSDPIPWLILLPLLLGLLSFLLGAGRGDQVAVVCLVIQLALVALLVGQVVAEGGQYYAVGGWGAPLGIDLHVDGLASVMLLLTHVVILPLGMYARYYFSHDVKGVGYFWPMLGFMLAAINTLFMSDDIFNIYVTIELLGLAAVGLVGIAGNTESILAAIRYLLVTLLGSGVYLAGVALIYGSYGSVSLAVLEPLIENEVSVAVFLAAILMLVGLLLKTALFPFHFWLPSAHGGALTPVSALLSALVIKASFYLILRMWLGLYAPLATIQAAQLLGGLGAVAILWGSIMAFNQTRLKMLVAYSTVAQIGYFFLLFPLITEVGSEAAGIAMQGGVIQLVAHALAKAAMFAAAGVMILSVGKDDIALLSGISRRLPLTLFTFALAGVTLMGLPPTGGFIAKWLLISSAVISGQWSWVVVMILGGLLSAGYVFKVLRQALLPAAAEMKFRLVNPPLEWPAFLLAFMSLSLSFVSGNVLNILGAG